MKLKLKIPPKQRFMNPRTTRFLFFSSSHIFKSAFVLFNGPQPEIVVCCICSQNKAFTATFLWSSFSQNLQEDLFFNTQAKFLEKFFVLAPFVSSFAFSFQKYSLPLVRFSWTKKKIATTKIFISRCKVLFERVCNDHFRSALRSEIHFLDISR